MKKIYPFLIIVVLLFSNYCSPLFCQENFEGKIIIEILGGNSGEISYYVKGNNVRMNVGSKQGNVSTIVDNDQNEMFILMPQIKKYSEMSFNDPALQKVQKDLDSKADKQQQVDFKSVGEKKVINGFKCEKWIYSDRNMKLDVWLTKDLGRFDAFNNPIIKNREPLWKRTIESTGSFPVKVEMIGKSGKKMSLDDSYFQPPSDYKKMKMPEMHSTKK